MLVLEFDPEGRVRFANDNLLEALRYRREALIGRALDELIPDSFRPNHPALLKALRNPEHWSGAFRLLCGDGKEAWLRAIWQPVNNGLGKLQYFTLCANDLTATITTAKEHESLIKALLRSTAVIEFKLTGEVVTANENFLRTMGYRLEQIQGKHHQLFCSRFAGISRFLGATQPRRVRRRALQAPRQHGPYRMARSLLQPSAGCP